MTPIGRVARTTAFKLSAIYLAVFSAFALIFVFWIGYASSQALNQQLADAVEEDILSLVEPWAEGGVLGLMSVIDERSRRPGAALYLLVDQVGRVLAGNVSDITVEAVRNAVPGPIATDYVDQGGTQRRAVVRSVRLSGGYILVVGRDIAENQRFGAIIRNSLIAAAAVLILLALGSWFFVSRTVLRRIDSIAAATRRIMAGDLAGRLDVIGTGDEFDRLAASLNAMLDRIEHLLYGLKNVSDNIAHDLKTPLTRMRNRIETALAGSSAGTDQRPVLQATIEDADNLIRTFNALLMIARIEAGAPGSGMTDVDVATIVADVAELYEPTAEEAGLSLSSNAEGPLALSGNRELLSQAVANLIDNAVKHTAREDGTGDGKVTVDARRDGDAIVVTVADNGPGIPEADRERVFERFVRLEESRSKPGTGLGLSLVSAVAKLHGGTVTLGDDHPGLVATLRLPIAGRAP